MLQSMQPQCTDREPASASFAGLLSALTSAKSQFAQKSSHSPSPDIWADELQDDVATLSYERALQNHSKYKSNNPVSSSAPVRATEAAFESLSQPGKDSKAATKQPAPDLSVPSAAPTHSRVKKAASVTLRMSEAEFAQLQRRANEANLSVSAYLRSCTFEAEALRAQVKQALAEMRNQSTAPQQPKPAAHNWLRLIRRQKHQ
jgi:hypothetical protein